ncbi:hypothetical protein Aspvir_004697 [Aspergillus viridinutans]|uniref:Uncharacterized protein n=1 Tax=Aspergillus viridinutans TaxID=75553 RepID=A0A9P3F3K7_ASPVI|nr:uncharacterized protein Aspvir_004697 [Aspergillus viridinutans]GIK00670.1 hypothetical protein Aspvir_004697 [Aspergillus viridinutans]
MALWRSLATSTSRLFRPSVRSQSWLRRGLATPPSAGPNDYRSRLRKLNDRLPPFLRSYTSPLLGAPGTHITSFLILHEITAIVPLLGLVASFHYGDWLPDFTSKSGFDEGVQRFGRWLRKKGWVEDADMDIVKADGSASGEDSTTESPGQSRLRLEDRKGVRLVLEFATAYAITKALLPVRIVASVWATPWFARSVLAPVGRGVGALLGKK